MSATHLLINLIGEIALLLWGIHMVQSGVTRVFGTDLRRTLGRALSTRFRAFLAGLGITALLQSSTATALMAMSFTGPGAIELVPALAVMLGANVGTTLIVQVLSFDMTLVFPVLIAAGVFAFRRGRGTRFQDLGRVAIGLGLMLLSLHLLAEAIAPERAFRGGARPARRADARAAAQRRDRRRPDLGGAFERRGRARGDLACRRRPDRRRRRRSPWCSAPISAAPSIPVLEGTGGDPVKLRLPLGNLATRLVGAALAAALPRADRAPCSRCSTGAPGRLAANFHTGFNLAVAALFIGLLPPMASLLVRLLPARPAADDPAKPLYLDPAALRTPAVALANAARETLRIVDVVESMLAGTQDDLPRRRPPPHGRDAPHGRRRRPPARGAAALHRRRSRTRALSEAEARRLTEVQSFAINLEHIGDIIDKNLTELVAKRMRLKLSLSPEGLAEIDAMYAQLLDHLRLAVAVFMSNDVDAARRLVAEKEQFRDLERISTEKHFARVREGRIASIETSGLHLDVVRDLKRIEAHLAATAYPLLERSGALKPTRLAS